MRKTESLLKQLYESELNPCNRKNPKNPDWKRLKQNCLNQYETLIQTLTDEQKNELKELKHMTLELEEMEREHTFKEGVHFGAKMIMELFEIET